MTAVTTTPTDVSRFVAPVPLLRLTGVHLRIWFGHRTLLVGTAIAVLFGVGGLLVGLRDIPAGAPADAVGRQFVASMSGYAFVWLAVGAVAGAAPFRNRWAELMLSFAPRRGRWFAGVLASVLVWAAAATVVVAVLCAAAVAVGGHGGTGAVAVFARLTPVVALTLLDVAVGAMLGAAARGVTVPLILTYVIAPALPLIQVHGVHLGGLVDLDAATKAFAGGSVGWRDVTGLCAWLLAPAVIAGWRLRRPL
jgi:hypothetical protein